MAATTIDDLQIKIEADAKTASDKLDALAQSMVKLASSLSINVGKMSGVAIGLNSITKASQNLNSRNITTMATAMGKIAGVDSAQISRVAGSMTQLKNSVSGGFNTDMTGIVNVANSLSKLGGKNATQGAQNLVLIKDQLAQFVQGMNQVGTFMFDPTGLTNTIKAIAKLGGKTATQATANLPSISAQLQNFVRQMNQIGSMSFDNKNLTDLVTSIGRLGSVASGRAVNNIPLLANNLKYLFDTLSKAPNVSQNIIQMTTALANLARTGASSGTAARSLGTNLFSFSKSAGNARKSAFSLAGAIGKFYATYWMVIRGLGLFRNAIDISSDLTEVENVVRTTFGDMEYKVNDFVQNSIQQFGMSELSVKQYASTFQAMGTAMDIGSKQIEKANSFLSGATDGYVGLSDSLSDVSLNLTKLTADIASFYDKDQADVAKDLQSIFSGMIVPLRKYGLDLTQATLKEWAMKNGMDADIKSMTQAEKAMLRYQYVLANTTAAQGDFARTADTWANQVRILKQSFQQLGGISGGALINAFKPFLRTLNFVMQKVISFATMVTNALGAIFGWKFEVSGGGVADDWSDAASSADDLADSTGKAADNTKKMKNNLLAIDELNVLNPDDSDAGSGGSGSGSGGAGGGAGGLVQADTIWKDFESNIKDLYQLGSVIGDKLSRAMESIDWDSIYEKARNFGTGLAQFLNGLISPRLFGNVGRTIANSLNTVMYAALSFGEEFDWRNLGLSIASGINKFFSNFDFTSLAKTINTWVQGLFETMTVAISRVDWGKIYDDIITFLENLDIKTVAIVIGAMTIKKIASLKIADAVLSAIGTSVSRQLASAIASKLGLELAANAGISSALLAAGGSVAATFVAGFKALLGSEAAAAALTFMNPIIVSFTGIVGIVAGAGLAVANFVSMWQNGFSWIKEAIMDVGIALVAVSAVILGAPALVAGVVAGIVATVATIAIIVKEHWEEISSFFTTTIPAWWNGTALPFIQSIPEKFMELVTNIVTFVSGLPGEIAYWLGFAIGSFVSWVADLVLFVSTNVPLVINGIIVWFSELPGKIWAWLVATIDKFGEWIKDGITLVNTKVPEIANGIINAFIHLPGKLLEIGENIINGLWEGVQNAWTFVKTGVTDLANNFVQGFKDALGIHSPSTVMAEVGGYTVTGFNEGVQGNTQSSIDAMIEWVSNITSALTPEIWMPAFNGMLTGFQTKWSELTTWWSGTAMPSFFSANVAPWFTDAFWNAKTNGMKLGLQQKWNEFVAWWKSSINLWFTVNVMPWFTVARWTEQGEHFRKALKDKWDEFSDQWHKDLTTWWNTDVTVWFTVAKWNAFGTNMKNGLYEGFKGIVQMVGNVMNGMIDVFNAGLSKIQKSMNSLISDFNKNAAVMGVSSLHKVHFDSISHVTIPAYEVGGFPEDGLFFANHNEMVGQFSNGRTAVANNDQIVAGIREGVKAAVTEALAPYLSDIADTNREIAEKDASINVDGRELVNAINSRISRNGFSFT